MSKIIKRSLKQQKLLNGKSIELPLASFDLALNNLWKKYLTKSLVKVT